MPRQRPVSATKPATPYIAISHQSIRAVVESHTIPSRATGSAVFKGCG